MPNVARYKGYTVRGTDDNFQLFMPQAKGADGQMLSLAFRFLRAKTPEERALVDLETHYTKVRN